jgi:hypothetical protein
MSSDVFSFEKQSFTVNIWVMMPCSGIGGLNAYSKLPCNSCQTKSRHNPEYTVWVKVSTFVTWRDSDVALNICSWCCCLCIPRTLRFCHHRCDSTECGDGANQNCQPFIPIHKIDWLCITNIHDYFLLEI